MTNPMKTISYRFRLAHVIIFSLCIITILVFSFFGEGFFARILVITGVKEEESVVSSYFFNGESFALAGDKLAIASTVGAQIVEESGLLFAEESFSMDNPTVSASESISVFYDIGGTAMCAITAGGESVFLPSEYNIRFADASENGYVSVITDYPGYRGRVSVYNPSYTPVFSIDCGTSGYPISARVSPSDILVINCVNASGSALHFYALNSEKELASVSFGQNIIRDFDFLANGTLAVITAETLTFLSDKGREQAAIDLTPLVLTDYNLQGKHAVLLLHGDLTGSDGILQSYSSSGELLGELSLDRSVRSISAFGKQILILYPNELTLYKEDFSNDISYQRVTNSNLCILTGKNEGLILGKTGAELIRFSK